MKKFLRQKKKILCNYIQGDHKYHKDVKQSFFETHILSSMGDMFKWF